MRICTSSSDSSILLGVPHSAVVDRGLLTVTALALPECIVFARGLFAGLRGSSEHNDRRSAERGDNIAPYDEVGDAQNESPSLASRRIGDLMCLGIAE
jgi:hypothetical protein